MSVPRLRAITCSSPAGLHRMAYHEWGNPNNPQVVLCVHGLTRTGRDFDALAQQLASQYRVICPDVVGRGMSDWLSDSAFYSVPQYTSDMLTLIGRLQPQRLHWVGTSMGGLIGLVYAGILSQLQLKESSLTPSQTHTALPDSGVRLDSLILNDVGPHIEPVSLERIGQYVGEGVSFTDFQAAVDYVKATCASFGPHSASQWTDLTRYVYIEKGGKWIKHYDLALATPFKQMTPELAAQGEAMLWGGYASIHAPLQIIRGADSDLLSLETCEKMLSLQPKAKLTQIPGVGHAPTLMSQEQIDVVKNFLMSLS